MKRIVLLLITIMVFSVFACSVLRWPPLNQKLANKLAAEAKKYTASVLNETKYDQKIGGSAFVYDPSGYLLTNAHIVRDAQSITIYLQNQSYQAVLTGTDEVKDVANLRITNSDIKFPVVKLGDSSKLKIGDWVMATGNPYGLGFSINIGYISAAERELSATEALKFIQTDISINPGNSGGPLINAQGKVVGINTRYIPGSGLGFAIPINEAKKILPYLHKGDQVSYWLGISCIPIEQVAELNPETIKKLSLSPPLPENGVVILTTFANSALKALGVRSGDIITSVGQQTIKSISGLTSSIIEQHEPFEIKIVRSGSQLSIAGELPEIRVKIIEFRF